MNDIILGSCELRMWPNRIADGSTRTSTPGIISDFKQNELDDAHSLSHSNSSNKNISQENANLNNAQLANLTDEFPMLDELDRLAKMSKYHTNGQLIKQDWLDRLTLKEIQKSVKNEKDSSKFFFLTVDLAQIKSEETKYSVLYYEEVSLCNFLEFLLFHLKYYY